MAKWPPPRQLVAEESTAARSQIVTVRLCSSGPNFFQDDRVRWRCCSTLGRNPRAHSIGGFVHRLKRRTAKVVMKEAGRKCVTGSVRVRDRHPMAGVSVIP